MAAQGKDEADDSSENTDTDDPTDPGNTTGKTDNESVETDDNTPLALCIALMVTTTSVGTASIYRRRRS